MNYPTKAPFIFAQYKIKSPPIFGKQCRNELRIGNGCFAGNPSPYKTEFIIVGAHRIQLARDGKTCTVPETNPIKTDAEC